MGNQQNVNIVQKIKENDSIAFAKFYSQTNDRAYRTAISILKNQQDSEDAVQSSYISLLEKIEQLENENQIYSWFYRIVSNKSKDLLKKKKPDLYSDFESDEQDISFEEQLTDETLSLPDELAENKEIQELVYNLVSDLPDEQRICVNMYFYNRLTLTEISNSLGISKNTAKSRLKYAREKLAKKVRELEEKGYQFHGVSIAVLINWSFDADSIKISKGVAKSIFKAILASSAIKGSSAAIATAIGTTVISKSIIATIAVVAVVAVSSAVLINTTVFKSKKSEPTIHNNTSSITQEVTIDAEHQKNIDEAMKYSNSDYKNNYESSISAQYGNDVYFADFKVDEFGNTYGSSMKKENILTGKVSEVLSVPVQSLLIVNDLLLYADFEQKAIFKIDLKKDTISPESVSKELLFTEADGPSIPFYSFYYKDGDIVYCTYTNSNEYSPQGTIYSYNINTGKTQIICQRENFEDMCDYNYGIVGVSKDGYYTRYKDDIIINYDKNGKIISQYKNKVNSSDNEYSNVFEDENYIILLTERATDYNGDNHFLITNKHTGINKNFVCNTTEVSISNNRVYSIIEEYIDVSCTASVQITNL